MHRTTMPSTKITTHVHTLIHLHIFSPLTARCTLAITQKHRAEFKSRKKFAHFKIWMQFAQMLLFGSSAFRAFIFLDQLKKTSFFLLRCRFVCFYFHPILDIQRMQWHTIENVVAL